ncbi:MAG TPA: PH domain-containing protein [Micromonosporaceae bacterium]
MSSTSADPVTIRPVKIRRVAWVLAPVVAVFFAILAAALSGSTGDGRGVFQPSDQIAMIFLGLLFAGGILLFARPKVVADRHTIKIQNILGGYELPWQVVREVRFDRGNPWLTLELHDDDVVAVLAVQATDKDHAVAAVRSLRALLAEHRSGPADRDASAGQPSPQDRDSGS